MSCIHDVNVHTFGPPDTDKKMSGTKMGMAHTVGQIADNIGTNPEALRKKLSRTYGQDYPGQSWGASAVVPDTVAAELLAKSGTKKERVQRASAPVVRITRTETPAPVIEVQEAPAPADVRGFALSALLIGIVLGHAGLVWYDCASLWATPGAIAGGLVFAVVLASVMLSSDTTKGFTAEICVWFVFFVDCAAFWVHKPVFSGYGVDNATTNALCVFVCATSFAALYIFKSYKND